MSHPILIRRLTGTHKGKDENFHTQEVSFGTGPNNTVRFDPTWDRGVSSSHARLYRDAEGVWWLADAGSSTGTHLNGQKLTQPRALVGSFVIELGQNGPRLEVTLPADALAAREQNPNGPAHLGQGGGGRGPARKKSKLPLAIAAMITLSFGAFWMLRTSSGGGSFHLNLGGVDSDTQLEASAKRLESAVGKVLEVTREGQVSAGGTAWAVGPGIFATNAHVVASAQRTSAQGGNIFIALNKQPEKKYRVQKMISHPEHNKGFMNSQGKGASAGTYDVGLLIVKEPCPVTFTLASEEKISGLDSGKRVASIGFPVENLSNSGSDNELPVATMQSGIITAVTDFWGNQADQSNRLLVQHNLPCTGGSSGSPVFDADGDVVAVLNAINVTYSLPPDHKGTFDALLNHAQGTLKTIVKQLNLQGRDQMTQEQLKHEETEVEKTKKALPALSQTVSAIARSNEILQELSELLKETRPDLSDDAKMNLFLMARARYAQLLEIKVGVLETARTPSAALINFAMRVDVLKELMDDYEKSRQKASGE